MFLSEQPLRPPHTCATGNSSLPSLAGPWLLWHSAFRFVISGPGCPPPLSSTAVSGGIPVLFGGRWRTLSHSATGNPCLSVMQARSAVYFHVSLETQRSLPCSTTLPGTSKSHSSSCITKLVTGNCETGSACVLRGLHARGDAGQVL